MVSLSQTFEAQFNEVIFYIFEKVPTHSWFSTFTVCKQFAEISKHVFVTKLVTKMLSSEWLGETQWLSFQGRPQAHNFGGDNTVSHFIFTKDGKITGECVNPNFVNLSSSIEGIYNLETNNVEFFKHFDHDKPKAVFHGRIIKYTGKLSIDNKKEVVILTGTTCLTQLEIQGISQNHIGDHGKFVLTSKIDYSEF